MKRITALLIASVLTLCLLAGCGDNGESDENRPAITVYYLRSPESRLSDGLLIPVSVPVNAGSDRLHAALSAVTAAPESDECVSAFPKDVSINSYSLIDGVLTVNFGSSYEQMPPYAKSMARACLVMTLCGLDEVGFVSVFVDGAPAEQLLSPEMILFSDVDESDYERQISLYFADNALGFLHLERHTLTIGQSKSMCAYVLDELLHGPQGVELIQAIPEDTQVISVKQSGDICTVDLSHEFLAGKPRTAAGERMAVFSIVDSLCSVNGVRAVQILVEGERCESYGHLNISMPLKFEPLFDQDSYDIKNDTVQQLYLRLEDGRLTGVPVMIDREKYLTREEAALRALMNITTSCGYASPISDAVDLVSVTLDNRVCTVTFTDRLIIVGSTERLNRTLEAIANTVYACGNCGRVVIKAGDTTVFNEELDAPDMTHVAE